MTATRAPFSTQLIGQAEKTMNAILDRHLAGRISEPEWVTMVLITGSGARPDRDHVAGRVAHALRVSQETAAAHITRLAEKGLVQVTADRAVTLTGTGQELFTSIRAQAGETTRRLWGDLPAADLEVAGRVLSIVLARAEAELQAVS
jgi:DNA-binding MarR family transcriptional regulator